MTEPNMFMADESNLVSTVDITSITENSAICNGLVIDEGASAVIERGVCWAETSEPTTNDFSGIPSYDRDLYFGSWIDEDGDCQNTRAEVLITESISSVGYRDSSSCVVDSGEWYDPYTNNIYYLASDVDIDHFVPLYDAFYSGAYNWPEYKRIEFANDLFLSQKSCHLCSTSLKLYLSTSIRLII